MNPDQATTVDPDDLPHELRDGAADLLDDEALEDERLDDEAQGHNLTADDTPDGDGEIDRMGRAAGLPADVDAPFAGVAEVDGRDRDRWELDPRSAEDAAARDDRAPA